MERKSVIGYSVVGIVVIAVAVGVVEKFIVPAQAVTPTQVNIVITPEPAGSCTLRFTWSPGTNPDPTEGPDYPYWVKLHSNSQDQIMWSVPPDTKGTYTVNFADSPWISGKSTFPVSDGQSQVSGPAKATGFSGFFCNTFGWGKCPYSYTIQGCNGYTGSKGSGPADPGLGVHSTK